MMEQKINELKQEINKQRELNISLFNLIPLATKEDPTNEKAEPILKQWREGSKRIKEMIKTLNELEVNFNKQSKRETSKKSFINGYGEATNREITNTNYRMYQNKLSKEILSFIGGK